MKSILQKTKDVCFLCGEPAGADPLDKHHAFGGTGCRKLSERYGLTVYLHHHRCHIFGADSVHQNKKNNLRIKMAAQRKAMRVHGWTVETFIKIFGKNYLQEDSDE